MEEKVKVRCQNLRVATLLLAAGEVQLWILLQEPSERGSKKLLLKICRKRNLLRSRAMKKMAAWRVTLTTKMDKKADWAYTG